MHAVPQPFAHAMMPQARHDELSRQNFTVTLKLFMTENVYPADEVVYEKVAKPKFVRENKREPKNHHEVRKLMLREPTTQMWSSIARTLQETLWYQVGECVDRQIDDLKASGAALTRKPKGTLTLDPSFVAPRYVTAVDIHAMPGNYTSNASEDDVYAGAVFDRGAYYYTKGQSGPKLESAGRGVIATLQHKFPNLKPRRILDLGCAIGTSTLPLVDTFPDAEVYGIDIGAGLLRYGHARAEYCGRKAHFSLQNAEATNFPDGYFDLVVSAGMFHETSRKATANILKECHRLLAPGGVTLHSDVPHNDTMGPHDAWMLSWDAHFNAEPYWETWNGMRTRDIMTAAGFASGKIGEAWRGRDAYGNNMLFDTAKDDPRDTNKGQLGRGLMWWGQK